MTRPGWKNPCCCGHKHDQERTPLLGQSNHCMGSSKKKGCSIKIASILRTCCLFVGCLATGMAYSMDAFNVFAESLKAMFLFNQSQIELIVSLGNVGMLSSLPTGLLLRRFGFRALSCVGLLTSTGSYLLLWGATFDVPFYQRNFVLIAIYFLLSGVGGGVMYISATTVNIHNYEIRYLGLVSGMIHSMKSAVLGLLMAVYNSYFATSSTNPIVNDPVVPTASNDSIINQTVFSVSSTTTPLPNTVLTNGTQPQNGSISAIGDLRGYFMCVALLYAATNTLAILVYGNYPATEDVIIESEDERKKKERDEEIVSSSGHFSLSVGRESSTDSDVIDVYVKTPLHLIKRFNYHAILWPATFFIAFRTCYINNVTGFLKSMDLEGYYSSLIYLIPILGTFLKPLIGFVSDAMISKVPRFGSLLLFATLECIVSVLCIFLLENVGIVALGLVTVIFGSCTVQTQSPAILVEYFGKDCFAYGWGFVTLAVSLGTLVLQMTYGALYDLQVAPGALVCYGSRCFTYFFIICVCLAFLTSLLLTLALVKTCRRNK